MDGPILHDTGAIPSVLDMVWLLGDVRDAVVVESCLIDKDMPKIYRIEPSPPALMCSITMLHHCVFVLQMCVSGCVSGEVSVSAGQTVAARFFRQRS